MRSLVVLLLASLLVLPVGAAGPTPAGKAAYVDCPHGVAAGACVYASLASTVDGCALELNQTYTCTITTSATMVLESPANTCASLKTRLIGPWWASACADPSFPVGGSHQWLVHVREYAVPPGGVDKIEQVRVCVDQMGDPAESCMLFAYDLHVAVPSG